MGNIHVIVKKRMHRESLRKVLRKLKPLGTFNHILSKTSHMIKIRKLNEIMTTTNLMNFDNASKKIKEDTDYPISKIVSETDNSKQTESKDSSQVVTPHKQSPQNKKYIKQSSNTNESRRVSYICTICRRKFKRMATLTRHMKNIHDDFLMYFL